MIVRNRNTGRRLISFAIRPAAPRTDIPIVLKIKEPPRRFKIERSRGGIRFGLERHQRAVQEFIDDG